MTPDEGFLSDIREHPTDDTPRLVYADWLDERDDPRGRYLRGEVELARLPEEDERYAALEAELRALRVGLEPDWVARAGMRYDLVLHSYRRDWKIHIIKALRELTGLGLREARDLAEVPPPVLVQTNLARAEAEHGRERLRCGRGRRVADVEVCVTGRAARPLPLVDWGQATYSLFLRGYPPERKQEVIRAIRDLTGCGLRGARALAEARAPVPLLAWLTWEEAEQVRDGFEGLADVEVRAVQNP